MGNIFFYSSSNKSLAILYFNCFVLFIFGANTNTTRQKGKYRKCLENKSLLATDCHGFHSQHELIHETIGCILIKTWTPLYMCVTSMVHHVEWVMHCVFNHFKTFFWKTRPFSLFRLTSECILLEKVQFVCIVLFYINCCFQLQFRQVKFFQDLFSHKTIANHLIQKAT